MTVQEQKKLLRREMAGQYWVDWSPMLRAFLALPELEQACTVMLFCGVGREPDTAWVIDELLRRGKRVALPVCMSGRQLQARRIRSREELKPGTWNIPEPGGDCPAVERDTIDLILVPNLCCDKEGYRLGHGAGYYDRYLDGYTGVTVALCPEAWLRETLPRDRFDLPVGLVLTETGRRRGALPRAGSRQECDR